MFFFINIKGLCIKLTYIFDVYLYSLLILFGILTYVLPGLAQAKKCILAVIKTQQYFRWQWGAKQIQAFV